MDPKDSPKFLRAIKFILPHEEEFARGHWGDENFVVSENVSGDSGGLTKYGIDQSSHPGVDIEHLTKDQATAIYFEEWQKSGFEDLPEKVAIALFDVRVNGGPAVKWLQAILNALLGAKLEVDGVIGPATLAAAARVNQDQFVAYFIGLRDERFRRLATGSRAKFLAGWKERDRDLEKFLSSSGSGGEAAPA